MGKSKSDLRIRDRLDANFEDRRLLRQVRREGALLLRGIRDMEQKLAVLRRAEVNLKLGRGKP